MLSIQASHSDNLGTIKTVPFYFRFSAWATRIFFFVFFYAGCPEGAYRVLKRVDFFFFFFVVYTNRYINLFIKLSSLLLGMYCFDCLQQKQANQNPFLSLILRGRGPTHPYLCDVNASFDIFIKDGLSRAILF